MKLYQFEFLLFLIIVNTTLSISFPFSDVLKPLEKVLSSNGFDYAKDKAMEKLKEKAMESEGKKLVDQIKPFLQSQSQSPKEVKGLYQIKQYLHAFGYLEQSGPFNNTLDQETFLALKTYQQYFNITGQGSFGKILQHMVLPRCGVPDMNFMYRFTDDISISFPKGNQWFPKGKKNLTYCFSDEIPLNMTNVFRKALTRWSQTTRVLNFTETESLHDADIKIGFYNMPYYDRINDDVVGNTLIKLNSANVTSGFILLDPNRYWVLPTEDGEFDLETAAMHQIGHLLGLEHSSDKESIMYPTILPSQKKKVQITDSDNIAIQKLYVSNLKANANSDDSSGCFKLFGSSSSLFISLSIGFAFVALLN